MLKMRKPTQWVVSACASGVLLAAAACGSADNDEPNGSGSGEDGGTQESAETDPISSVIWSWPEVCDVFDPDSILGQVGGTWDEDSPSELGPDEGFFIGAQKCNGAFRVESDPDQTQSLMYLNLAAFDTAEQAQEAYDELWEDDFAQHAERDPSTQLMLATEEDMAGDWDDADMFISVGSWGSDRVWAYFLDGSYMVQVQLQFPYNRGVHVAAQDNEEDLSQYSDFDFTALDVGSWVKNTYLPQVHGAIQAKIEEGMGE